MDEQAIVKLVPGAADSDADGVKMSLEAARALAVSGEPEEALRLVRRAVEGAEQAGDDMRAIALARAAADMANEIERAKKGPDAGDADAPASKRSLPSPPSRKSVPTPPPMPASSTGAELHAPAPPSTRASHAPPAPSTKSSPNAAQEPPAEPQVAPAAAAPAEPAPAHEPAQAAEPERIAPAPRKVEPRPAAAPHVASHAAPPPEMSELVSQGRAVRVLVKRSARDESLYIVRPHATAHVPVGAREAFLVLGDADPDFLSGATR